MSLFDAVASNSGYPPNDISFSHSLGDGSGNDRIVLVGILSVGGTSETISSCTYNSTSMSLLAQVSETYFGRETWMRVYYLLDSSLPSSSGSYTVDVDFGGAGSSAYYGIVSAISYTEVAQSAPPYASDSYFDADGQYSTNITVASDSGLLVDFGGIEMSGNPANSQAPGSGQTERLDLDYVEINQAISEKSYSSSGSNLMAQTPNDDYVFYGHIVIELEDADTGPGPSKIVYLGSQGYTDPSGTSISGSYTCHAGSYGKRKLLVAAGCENTTSSPPTNVTGVTYDGEALEKVDEYDYPGTGYNNIAWFYLDESKFPSTPGSYTLQANYDESFDPAHMMVLEVDNAKQGDLDADNANSAATSNTLNTTITTLEDYSWVIGACVTGDVNTFTPQSGQTERVDQTGGGGGSSSCMGHEEIESAGASNMQWGTSTTVNRIIQMVLALAPHIEGGNPQMIGKNM